jgi:hypothetical protein
VECRRENVTEEGLEVGGKNSRSVHSATVGVCDFFILRCSLRPESPQEHLQTSIAGVPSAALGTGSSTPHDQALCHRDKSVVRSAQDDEFVGGA